MIRCKECAKHLLRWTLWSHGNKKAKKSQVDCFTKRCASAPICTAAAGNPH